ncbi:MAG TPA: SusC/RagA family TonB-linked outer membrane protein [Gemmatimonadales bacterium]|nr:SusC/RagA family TonB-linked outer membrane protein [Gemmatimonadales bacterium]
MIKPRTFSATVCAGALLLLVGAAFHDAAAQSAVITGKVTGRQGEALGGAIVQIEELGSAVATTTTGTYTLTVPAERTKGQTVTLRARYIGYQAATRQVTLTPGTQSQDLELKFDPMTLDVVVVTGTAAGTELKKVPFAVAQVNAAQLQEAPAVSALGSLEGKVAGVRLISPSGEPGGEPVIRLRAATALTSKSACTSQPCASTNQAGPLVIVDGTITRFGLADISSQDIDHIEIVKGAAASSLYGSDAAEGVIQVFTKRGDKVADGRTAVTVRNEYGQSIRPKAIPISLAHPYLVDTIGPYTDSQGSAVKNGDFITPTGDLVGPLDLPSVKGSGIADIPYSSYARSVYDAQTALLTHGAFYTNYISIGQRRGNTNYNVSFENTKQDGVIRLLQGYGRQNFRVNVDQALTPRLDLSVGGFFGKSTNNKIAQGPGAPFFAVTFIEPYINLFAPNPDGTPYAALIPHQLPNAANPLYTLANEHISTDRTRYTGYGKATYRIFDWLSLEGNYNYDEESSNFTDETPKNFLNASGVPTAGTLVKIDSAGRTFNTGITLTSTRNFTVGGVRVRNILKGAYLYEDQRIRALGDTGKAFTVSATPEFTAVDFTQLSPFSYDAIIRSKNYYVVSNFDINDRYILDGLVRWDGSSLFGPLRRWQTYFRVSGAYRLSQDFHINGVDELKLRASYGTAGLRPSYRARYETFDKLGGGFTKVTLGNDSLKPAHSGETEIGGNMDFLGRFSLDYSFSRKNTTDQILLVPLSASAFGYKYQWQNAATLLGRTHELSLGVIIADRPDLSWRLNVAADRTRQYITAMSTAPFLTGPAYAGSTDVTQVFRIAPGETFGVIYGTRIVRNINELYDAPGRSPTCPGTWCPDSFVVNEDGYVVKKSTYHTSAEKFLTYVDPQGQGIVKIGDVNPDFNASFTTNFRYKGLSAYALVDWVQGGNIYNGTRQWPFFEYRDRIYDQSGKPTPNCAGTTDPAHCPYSTGKKPIAYYQGLYNGINPIDFFVESGTYVKIKELNVSYTFDRSAVEKLNLGINSLRIGVIGRNLFTFTKYSGYDPEVAGLSGDPYSFRFDGFSYPNFRTFTGFAEINF